MTAAPVAYTAADGVAWITLDRPPLNILDITMMEDLDAALERALPQSDFVVFQGAGAKAFCAGADLKEMAETQMRVPPKNLFVEFNRTLKTDKPIIAAVNGHAFAGGFRIAQMADLVVGGKVDDRGRLNLHIDVVRATGALTARTGLGRWKSPTCNGSWTARRA